MKSKVKILVPGYTFRTDLDTESNIHCIELFAACDALYGEKGYTLYQGLKPNQKEQGYKPSIQLPAISKNLTNKFDAIMLQSQFSSKKMIAKYPDDEVLKAYLIWVKAWLGQWPKDLLIVEQDPRPKFKDFWNEFPQATLLTTHDAYGLNIRFGNYSAKRQHKPWFPKIAIEYEGTVFCAYSYDEERHKMLNKYLPDSLNHYVAGPIETIRYKLPSLTQFKTIFYEQLRSLISKSAFQLVLYSHYHQKIGFWQTTRVFQAMTWGSLALWPIEYRDMVPKIIPDELFIKDSTDVLRALANRDELIEVQKEAWYKMIAD